MAKIKNDEIFKEIPKPESKEYRIEMIQDVNFKPHPYTIGTQHVVFASDHYSGMLGESSIRDGERIGITCAHKGCKLMLHEHTSDKVLVIVGQVKGKQPKELENIDEYLKSIRPILEKFKVDGVVFVKGE